MKRWKLRRKSAYSLSKEPFTLSPDPMAKEGQLAAVIAVPLLGFLGALIYVAKTYYITQEDFALFALSGLALWICSLVGMFAMAISRANKYMLFDREFGFTERLHPRLEIYALPEDIRELWKPDDKLQKPEQYKQRMKELGFDDTMIKQMLDVKLDQRYMYYFRHKDGFLGWDATKQEVPLFHSHVVFTKKPFDTQFVFGAGQENWYMMVLYNHPHAESDNVKVIGWASDPVTSEPMPLTILIHSSLNYKTEETAEEEKESFTILEAFGMLNAKLHGILESLRKKNEHLTVLKDSKLHDVDDIVSFGHDVGKADRKLEEAVMRPMSRGWLHSNWVKAIIAITTVSAIVLIVAIVLHWVDIGNLFGGA